MREGTKFRLYLEYLEQSAKNLEIASQKLQKLLSDQTFKSVVNDIVDQLDKEQETAKPKVKALGISVAGTLNNWKEKLN